MGCTLHLVDIKLRLPGTKLLLGTNATALAKSKKTANTIAVARSSRLKIVFCKSQPQLQTPGYMRRRRPEVRHRETNNIGVKSRHVYGLGVAYSKVAPLLHRCAVKCCCEKSSPSSSISQSAGQHKCLPLSKYLPHEEGLEARQADFDDRSSCQYRHTTGYKSKGSCVRCYPMTQGGD
jgi:hypothetical protein